MKFAAVHRAFMLMSPAIDADCNALGAWLRLYSFASSDGVEEPIVMGAKLWGDRKWLMHAQLTASDVAAAVTSGLAHWDGDDLLVVGYDDAGAVKIKTLRENGKYGGLGGRPPSKTQEKKEEKPSGLKNSNPLTLPYPTSPSLPQPDLTRSIPDLARSSEDGATAPATPIEIAIIAASVPSGETQAQKVPRAVAPAGLPPVLVYPCNGAERTWALSRAQVEEWRGNFPGLDIERECRAALAWVAANHGKRKTARGMPRFLVAWLTRSNDRGAATLRAANGSGHANGVGHFKAVASGGAAFSNGRVVT